MHKEYGDEQKRSLFSVPEEQLNRTDDDPGQKHGEEDVMIAIAVFRYHETVIQGIAKNGHKNAHQVQAQQITLPVFRIVISPHHTEKKQGIRASPEPSEPKGGGRKIAEEISRRVKRELGITVSIGISWNKIFAKLGSDYKKPDGITAFTKENYKELLWRLPAADLLYVGRSTRNTLNRYGIKTVGELALSDPKFLERLLGKMGLVLYTFANGWDESPVSPQGYEAPVKSIGNSTTTPRDLENNLDVQIVLMALAESVAARLRKHGFKCKVVSISIRDNGLYSFSRQKKLERPTDITNEIMKAANELFREHYNWQHPIRSLGVRAESLVLSDIPIQFNLFVSEEQREKQEKMDQAVDDIRRRFGYFSVQKAFMYQDKALASLDAQSSHTVHPIGYFNGR